MALLGRLIVATMPLAPKFIIRMVASRYVAGSKLEALNFGKGKGHPIPWTG